MENRRTEGEEVVREKEIWLGNLKDVKSPYRRLLTKTYRRGLVDSVEAILFSFPFSIYQLCSLL